MPISENWYEHQLRDMLFLLVRTTNKPSRKTSTHRDLGWGLLSQFSPFRYFPNFPALSKQTLDIEYHVYIWQVSPQLSCGDTCQIWTWFKGSNSYFCKIENFAYGEINERSFSNPHPWTKIHRHDIDLNKTTPILQTIFCKYIYFLLRKSWSEFHLNLFQRNVTFC